MSLNYQIDLEIYNINVQKGINEWLKMREKRENYEITDQEYIEWKLNFKLEKELY